MNDDVTSSRVDPRAYLRPLWARKWVILTIVAAVTAATYVYFDRKPRVYESSTQIFVQSSPADQVIGGQTLSYVDSARIVANQAKLIGTRSVAEDVARRLSFTGDPGALLGGLSVKTSKDTDFVTITARANTGQDAATRANAFAQAFSSVRSASNRRRLAQALGQARAELSSLPPGKAAAAARSDASARVRQLEAVTQLPSGGAQVTDRAIAPGSPIEPRPVRSAVFAFFLSLLLAVGLAFVIDLFDRRIKSVEDLEATYPFPILAVVPHEDVVAPLVNGALSFSSALRESFRSLRTSIGLTSLDRPTKRILVTSAVSGEGKSTVVRNLALAYAEAGQRVVVVETDLRRPTLAGIFNVERRPGLTDVLAGTNGLTVDLALQRARVEAPAETLVLDPVGNAVTSMNGHHEDTFAQSSVQVLTSGPTPPNPPGVLAAERTHRLIDDVSEGADVVIIDSPPLLAVSDAVPLLPRVDAVVLVARLNHSTAGAGKRLIEVLELVPDVHIAGVVINDVQSGRLQESGLRYYYYGPTD